MKGFFSSNCMPFIPAAVLQYLRLYSKIFYNGCKHHNVKRGCIISRFFKTTAKHYFRQRRYGHNA